MRGTIAAGLCALGLVSACCCPPAPPGSSSYGSQGASLRFEEQERRPHGISGTWCVVTFRASTSAAITRFTLVNAYAQDVGGTVLDTSNATITSLAAGQSQILEFNFTRAACSSISTVRVESR